MPDSQTWSVSSKAEVDAHSGLATWEASRDLAKYVFDGIGDAQNILHEVLMLHSTELSIIEFGCGSALPLLALLRSLAESEYRGKVHAIFQDYEEETLRKVTRPKVDELIRSVNDSFKDKLLVDFIASAWESMDVPICKMDIVLSSECVYREDLYESFSKVLSDYLSPTGVALVAGKRYYFGCGGGTMGFADHLEKTYPQYKAELVQTVEDKSSNTREILQIRNVATA